MSVIDCSKCIHCEVCGDQYANDGRAGECSYFLEYNQSGDCISRESVRSKIWKERVEKDEGCNSEYIRGLKTAIGFIDNAPPVEPERPQGEWYYGEDECGQDGWFCSECGFFVPWYYQYYEKDINFIRDYKACPHCLAEMITYTGKDRDTKGGAE